MNRHALSPYVALGLVFGLMIFGNFGVVVSTIGCIGVAAVVIYCFKY
jgi:hypothetical protein